MKEKGAANLNRRNVGLNGGVGQEGGEVGQPSLTCRESNGPNQDGRDCHDDASDPPEYGQTSGHTDSPRR